MYISRFGWFPPSTKAENRILHLRGNIFEMYIKLNSQFLLMLTKVLNIDSNGYFFA